MTFLTVSQQLIDQLKDLSDQALQSQTAGVPETTVSVAYEALHLAQAETAKTNATLTSAFHTLDKLLSAATAGDDLSQKQQQAWDNATTDISTLGMVLGLRINREALEQAERTTAVYKTLTPEGELNPDQSLADLDADEITFNKVMDLSQEISDAFLGQLKQAMVKAASLNTQLQQTTPSWGDAISHGQDRLEDAQNLLNKAGETRQQIQTHIQKEVATLTEHQRLNKQGYTATAENEMGSAAGTAPFHLVDKAFEDLSPNVHGAFKEKLQEALDQLQGCQATLERCQNTDDFVLLSEMKLHLAEYAMTPVLDQLNQATTDIRQALFRNLKILSGANLSQEDRQSDALQNHVQKLNNTQLSGFGQVPRQLSDAHKIISKMHHELAYTNANLDALPVDEKRFAPLFERIERLKQKTEASQQALEGMKQANLVDIIGFLQTGKLSEKAPSLPKRPQAGLKAAP